MSDFKDILNPVPSSNDQSDSPDGAPPKPDDRDESPSPVPKKKLKLAKDAAIFVKNEIRGSMNYPPYEERSFHTQQEEFEVHPKTGIAQYPRHIPYNSDKRSFLEKTGRESFEVLQYEFVLPGNPRKYVMMWDYNIGLVRTTALFKAHGYSKTTPSKMLDRNPGLRELCHSITGGALAAQGYWMPFEAARAVAITFCWRIRHALTPIFGPQFPDLCIHPDSDKFGNMIIDPAIIQHCEKQVAEFRDLEIKSSSRASSMIRTPMTPDSPRFLSPIEQQHYSKFKTIDNKNLEVRSHSKVGHQGTQNGALTPANTPRSKHFQMMDSKITSSPQTPSTITPIKVDGSTLLTADADKVPLYPRDWTDQAAFEDNLEVPSPSKASKTIPSESLPEKLAYPITDLEAARILMDMRYSRTSTDDYHGGKKDEKRKPSQ